MLPLPLHPLPLLLLSQPQRLVRPLHRHRRVGVVKPVRLHLPPHLADARRRVRHVALRHGTARHGTAL